MIISKEISLSDLRWQGTSGGGDGLAKSLGNTKAGCTSDLVTEGAILPDCCSKLYSQLVKLLEFIA